MTELQNRGDWSRRDFVPSIDPRSLNSSEFSGTDHTSEHGPKVPASAEPSKTADARLAWSHALRLPPCTGITRPNTAGPDTIRTDKIHINGNGTTPQEPNKSSRISTEGVSHRIVAHVELLHEIRAALSIGHGPDHSRAAPSSHTLPFVFHHAGQAIVRANNPGLEGFVFGEREFRLRCGDAASEALVPHYIRYLQDLAKPIEWLQPMHAVLSDLDESPAPNSVRLSQLLHLTHTITAELQEFLRTHDAAQWSRTLRAYHVYTSATPLLARRLAYGDDALAIDVSALSGQAPNTWFSDLSQADFELVREYGFNALRVMGIYPRGQENRKGTGQGSPFSIRRYEIDPALGSPDDVRATVAAGFANGVRTIFEFVPNHTAVDADLVRENPALFVHRRDEPQDQHGYYMLDHPTEGRFWVRHGAYRDEWGRHYFTDTLQLDLSNPETRARAIGWALDLIRGYGIDGLRVDMSHHILHANLANCWGDELSQALPSTEFLAELIHAVKKEAPHVAVLGEVLGGTAVQFEHLSAAGIDLIYNLDDLPVRGGQEHVGWFQALLSRDPARIARALDRAQFLQWQRGGAGTVTFVGQHDRPAPWRELGDWVHGALYLTILQPGPLCMYAGTEAQFEFPCPEDGKMISFVNASAIDWSGIYSEFGEYVHSALLQSRKVRAQFGEDLQLVPLRDTGAASLNTGRWIGFALVPRGRILDRRSDSAGNGQDQGASFRGALVFANLSDTRLHISVENPEIGLAPFDIELGPRGPLGQHTVCVEPSLPGHG